MYKHNFITWAGTEFDIPLEYFERNTSMKGWKTWTGAILIAASGILHTVGLTEIANLITTIGAAIGIVGIGHKIEKTKAQ